VSDIVGDVISSVLADRWIRRRADRQLTKSRVECSLRVVGGSQPGLTRRWRAGTAELAPGSMRFWRRLPGGTDASIEVVSVSRASRWPPRGGGGDATPTAVLEWAVLDRHLHWAIDQVSRPVATSD
jgi:hypothetical protein